MPKSKRIELLVPRMLLLFDKGLSYSEIGRVLSVEKSTVRKIIRKQQAEKPKRFCNECGVEIEYQRADKEYCSISCYMKMWHRNSPRTDSEKENDKLRNKKLSLERKYNLSIEDYNSMVANQQARCDICLGSKKLNVDHCHLTGEVRGLLCHKCNTTIAFLEAATSSHYRYLAGVRTNKKSQEEVFCD